MSSEDRIAGSRKDDFRTYDKRPVLCTLFVWNCIGLPEGFLFRVVVSYFFVLGCRFAQFVLRFLD